MATLSFVVPARNEGALIAGTLDSIHAAVRGRFPYEIIVADHASTDRTAEIARARGACVITQRGGTIGALRNTGARQARGDILVFLDADVLLTDEWSARIPTTVELLTAKPDVVTGSLCCVPGNATWLERTWFAHARCSSHLGSAHMIFSCRFFEAVGGFDESLTTGEDFELCRRALLRGATLLADRRLRVEHLGFPKTIAAFVKREIWHGTGDFRSFAHVVRSKVAMLALAVALLHGVALWGLAGRPFTALLAVAGIVLICVASSVRKYRHAMPHIVALNSAIFYLYYVARALSALRSVSPANVEFAQADERVGGHNAPISAIEHERLRRGSDALVSQASSIAVQPVDI